MMNSILYRLFAFLSTLMVWCDRGYQFIKGSIAIMLYYMFLMMYGNGKIVLRPDIIEPNTGERLTLRTALINRMRSNRLLSALTVYLWMYRGWSLPHFAIFARRLVTIPQGANVTIVYTNDETMTYRSVSVDIDTHMNLIHDTKYMFGDFSLTDGMSINLSAPDDIDSDDGDHSPSDDPGEDRPDEDTSLGDEVVNNICKECGDECKCEGCECDKCK